MNPPKYDVLTVLDVQCLPNHLPRHFRKLRHVVDRPVIVDDLSRPTNYTENIVQLTIV